MKAIKVILCLAFSVICMQQAGAQSGTLRKAAEKAAGYFRDFDITGIWVYEGVDVAFQSDNLLRKAGGTLMAGRIENSVDEQLKKLGFTEGATTFTFEQDGTFTHTTAGRTLRGSYEFDKTEETITLKYLNHIPLKTTLSGSGSHLSLLFEAGSFLSMAAFVGSNSGIGAGDTLSSLLKSYDGMMIGLKLRRQ